MKHTQLALNSFPIYAGCSAYTMFMPSSGLLCRWWCIKFKELAFSSLSVHAGCSIYTVFIPSGGLLCLRWCIRHRKSLHSKACLSMQGAAPTRCSCQVVGCCARGGALRTRRVRAVGGMVAMALCGMMKCNPRLVTMLISSLRLLTQCYDMLRCLSALCYSSLRMPL